MDLNKESAEKNYVLLKEEHETLTEKFCDCNVEDQELVRTENYDYLIKFGIHQKVAAKLDTLFKSGKLVEGDLDERALNGLKEFPVDGALDILGKYLTQNLNYISHKSIYLCSAMKEYRIRSRVFPYDTWKPNIQGDGANNEEIQKILTRTGYTLDVTSGQRKYGGPPPGWKGPKPDDGCEVFCANIPKNIYEDMLIPLFEKYGSIWDLRLMMNPITGKHRKYAFITYTKPEEAKEAVKNMDNFEILPEETLKVNLNIPNKRLYVAKIPKVKTEEELFDGFSKVTEGLKKVIVLKSLEKESENRGFCFLEYESHILASLAKRFLNNKRSKMWGIDIIADWADPQEEPNEEQMLQVKVLYVGNLSINASEQMLKEIFQEFGTIKRVRKVNYYAFIHFEKREFALEAMHKLNNTKLCGKRIQIALAKPCTYDKKRSEKILTARDIRMQELLMQRYF